MYIVMMREMTMHSNGRSEREVQFEMLVGLQGTNPIVMVQNASVRALWSVDYFCASLMGPISRVPSPLACGSTNMRTLFLQEKKKC